MSITARSSILSHGPRLAARPLLAATATAALLATSNSAWAVSDCDYCVNVLGGVWLNGEFCMRKLEPVLGPKLEPIPEEDLDFDLEPGHFNDIPWLDDLPSPPSAPVYQGSPINIGTTFWNGDPGTYDVLNNNGQVIHTYTLGQRQLAVGAVADWNGHTDLVMITIMDAFQDKQKSHIFHFSPVDTDNDRIEGTAVIGSALNNLHFSMAFSAETIPTPSAAMACLGLFGVMGLRRRR